MLRTTDLNCFSVGTWPFNHRKD